MDLNKYTNTSKSDILHTSGYAQAANGERMGATSSTSFRGRLQRTAQRKVIAEYRQSRMGQLHGALRAKIYTPEKPGVTPSPIAGRQASNAMPSAPRFVEPPARTFNKYS